MRIAPRAPSSGWLTSPRCAIPRVRFSCWRPDRHGNAAARGILCAAGRSPYTRCSSPKGGFPSRLCSRLGRLPENDHRRRQDAQGSISVCVISPWPKVVSATLEGQAVVAIEARSFSPGVTAIAASAHTPRARFVLASRQDIAGAAESQYAPVLIDKAVNVFWRDTADLSARTPQKLRQPLLAAALSGLAIGSVLVAPELAAGALAAVLAVPFLCVVLLRAAAVIEICGARSHPIACHLGLTTTRRGCPSIAS